VAENDHPPLTWHIALTTVYALTCYTVIVWYVQYTPDRTPTQCEID